MKRLLLLLLLCWAPLPAAAADFSNWAAIIVAGDDHAHSGAPSEVFDNARRDLGHAFQGIGFAPGNMLEFSVQPEKYPGEAVQPALQEPITRGLSELTRRATAGCLVYFTSHGSPDGIVVADRLVDPGAIAGLVSDACGARPTVVIMAACYSGVFVPTLAAPNRLVLTAARPDRPSFGCGEQDRYTFFDTCMLSEIGASGSFPELADRVKLCVATHEREIDALPSEPQLSVGSQVADALNWKTP